MVKPSKVNDLIKGTLEIIRESGIKTGEPKVIIKRKAVKAKIPTKGTATEPKVQKKVEPVKAKAVKVPDKRLTFYMNGELHLAWEQYKLNQLMAGKKVSFQGVVEDYLKKITK